MFTILLSEYVFKLCLIIVTISIRGIVVTPNNPSLCSRAFDVVQAICWVFVGGIANGLIA